MQISVDKTKKMLDIKNSKCFILCKYYKSEKYISLDITDDHLQLHDKLMDINEKLLSKHVGR